MTTQKIIDKFQSRKKCNRLAAVLHAIGWAVFNNEVEILRELREIKKAEA